MGKKIFLETEEYDIYMFPVPGKVLKGTNPFALLFAGFKCGKWVLSQMEKLHPCFDSRFLWDISYYREHGQINALVTVAEKLCVAGHVTRKSDEVYVRRPEKRRVFRQERPLQKYCLLSVFLLVLGASAVYAIAGDAGANLPERAESELSSMLVDDDFLELPFVSYLLELPEVTRGETVDGMLLTFDESEELVDGMLPESDEPNESDVVIDVGADCSDGYETCEADYVASLMDAAGDAAASGDGMCDVGDAVEILDISDCTHGVVEESCLVTAESEEEEPQKGTSGFMNRREEEGLVRRRVSGTSAFMRNRYGFARLLNEALGKTEDYNSGKWFAALVQKQRQCETYASADCPETGETIEVVDCLETDGPLETDRTPEVAEVLCDVDSIELSQSENVSEPIDGLHADIEPALFAEVEVNSVDELESVSVDEVKTVPSARDEPVSEEGTQPMAPYLSDTPAIDLFIEALYSAGGSISSFRWQTMPAAAIITVTGCYPEDVYACADEVASGVSEELLPDLQFSSISYEDNNPTFSISLDYSGFRTEEKTLSQNSVRYSSPVQAPYRKLMVETGGSVQKESVQPPSASGVIPFDSWKMFSAGISQKIAESSEDGSFGISSFSFETANGQNDVYVSLVFAPEQPSFFPLEQLGSLFMDSTSQHLTSVSETVVTAEALPDYGYREVGSACIGDGLYVSFYRDLDGRIIKGEPYEKK